MIDTSPQPRIRIELPAALRVLADQAGWLEVQAGSVAEALAAIQPQHPHLVSRILTRGGQLRPHVNLFVNDQDIRQAQGLNTALSDGDVVLVVPSVAGG